MLTDRGNVLLEFNVRMGDPEAQVILPRLDGRLGPLLLAAAAGRIPDEVPARAPAVPGAAVGIVLAAKGYPENPRRGHPIGGLDVAAAGGALVFHAGTVGRPQGGFGTNGGRVLTVVGRGPDLAAARDAAERAADAITWDGLHRRRDIAADVPEPVAGAAIGVPA
jgi:phosphoribosylamine--glycine ligase